MMLMTPRKQSERYLHFGVWWPSRIRRCLARVPLDPAPALLLAFARAGLGFILLPSRPSL